MWTCSVQKQKQTCYVSILCSCICYVYMSSNFGESQWAFYLYWVNMCVCICFCVRAFIRNERHIVNYFNVRPLGNLSTNNPANSPGLPVIYMRQNCTKYIHHTLGSLLMFVFAFGIQNIPNFSLFALATIPYAT